MIAALLANPSLCFVLQSPQDLIEAKLGIRNAPGLVQENGVFGGWHDGRRHTLAAIAAEKAIGRHVEGCRDSKEMIEADIEGPRGNRSAKIDLVTAAKAARLPVIRFGTSVSTRPLHPQVPLTDASRRVSLLL
jgi:hypothetical protein